MTTPSLTLVTIALCGALAASLGVAGLRQLMRLRLRCGALEESLRVYGNANAAIGRHVTALEDELRTMRQRLAAFEDTGLRTRLREPSPAEQPVVHDTAEQRLSRLLRSRFGEAGAGHG